MCCYRIISTIMVIGGLLGMPGLALAQNTSTSPVKTIGKSSTAKSDKPELIQSLIVMNSRGVTLKGDQLTLTGVMPNSIVFADRPVRLAGHELTAHLIEEWNQGNDSFGKDPPNATVSVFSKEGSSVKDVVVVLKSPKLAGDTLTFTVQVLEGDLAGANGPASVFIDIFGVWRRAAFRGAVYGGAVAAAGAAAAYGAYGPYAPPPPYYRPPCGYYPQPPCY